MSKKSLFIFVSCLLIVFSSIIVGIIFSIADNNIILTLSSTLTSTLNKIKVEKGSTVKLDDYVLTAEGYEFLGWYTTPLMEEKINDGYIFTSNKTIYAGFSKIVNVNEIEGLNNINSKSYTIVSTNTDEKIDHFHIKKLIDLGATRIDLSNCYVKNQKITSEMFASTNIREVVFGNDIVTIGSGSFENCFNLENIELTSSVKTIESKAFKNCCNLKFIEMKEGLLEIQECVFEKCSKINSISIPSTVNNIYNNFISNSEMLTQIDVHIANESYASKNGILYSKDFKSLIKCPENKSDDLVISQETEIIEDYAFFKSKINSVRFSTNIKKIGNKSFFGCENLKNIQVSSTFNYTLGSSSFEDCKSLETVVLGAGIEGLGDHCFKNNFNLKTIDILEENGFDFIGQSCFENCYNVESFVTPESTVELGVKAFYNCSNLKEFVFGKNITEIPNRLFYNCVNLKTVEIEGNIKKIGDSAFYNCRELKNVGNLNSVESVGSSVFYNCNDLLNISLDNIETVSQYMFYNCSSIENISLLKVKKIEDYSFFGCGKLTNFVVGDRLETIENNSFLNSPNLNISLINNSNFVITNGIVMSSDKKTLYYVNSNDQVTDVTIPAEVEIIKNNALCGKKYIKNIFVENENTKFASIDGCLVNLDSTELIAVPSGRMINEFTVPESVKIIKEHSIQSSYIEKISIHNNVIKIENNALSFVPNLKTIYIPFVGTGKQPSSQRWISAIFGGGQNIENNTGINNGKYLPEKLENVYITNESYIPSFAFYNANRIQNIYINESVERVNEYAFYGCLELRSISFDGNLQYVGAYAFENCKNIKTFTLGYNASLIINKTALSSIGKLVDIYVIHTPDIIVDITAKKTYKNKFFGVSVNSRQWKWYFTSQGE